MNLRNTLSLFSIFSNNSSDNQVESKSLLPKELESLINDPTRIDISWVKSRRSESGYIFVTESLEIDADPKTVLDEAIKVHRYRGISRDAITAYTDGEVTPGNTIKLELYKGKLIGRFIPSITAIITVADKINDDWVIGWSLPLPFGAGFTQRYQVLETLPNNKTRSTIGDKIPGTVGFFSHLLMNKIIKNAFKDLNEGLKREAESRKMRK